MLLPALVGQDELHLGGLTCGFLAIAGHIAAAFSWGRLITGVGMKGRALVGAGALAVAGLIATPAVSSAAPLTRVVNTVTAVDCVFETVEGDFVFFGATSTTRDGGSGSFMFVESPDYELLLQSKEPGTATFDDGAFSAEVLLYDFDTGEPVGVASVEATRTQSGEPVTERLRERYGNSWTMGTVTTTEYRVDIESVTVPGYTVLANDDDDCTSRVIAFDVKTTNPNAQVYADSDFGSAICSLEGLANGEVLLSGALPEMHFEVVIDDGVNPQKASGDFLLRGGSVAEATVPLIDLLTEEEVAELTISVQLDRIGRRSRESESFDGITEWLVVVPYRATITVSTSDGRSGVAHCYAEHITTKTIIRPTADVGEH
jgi:hypothetical protein